MNEEWFGRLEKHFDSRFDAVEKLITSNDNRNAMEHEKLRGSIEKLFEENKAQNAEVDTRFFKTGERIGKIEAESARMDERHKMSIWFVGIGVTVISGIVSFAIKMIGG